MNSCLTARLIVNTSDDLNCFFSRLLVGVAPSPQINVTITNVTITNVSVILSEQLHHSVFACLYSSQSSDIQSQRNQVDSTGYDTNCSVHVSK